jgi:hypothetical protein
MDPWLEHPSLWPDVHNALVVALRNQLVTLLRPRYAVLLEERSYLAEPEGVWLVGRPDAVVARLPRTDEVRDGAEHKRLGPLAVEIPIPDRIREVWLEVRLPGGGEVITVVEVLSPTNKRPGSEGRRTYEAKRQAILGSRTHLVEIDLCRSGQPMPLRGPEIVADYRILVSRAERRPHGELTPFDVPDPIPGFRLPLRAGETEPVVDLGAILHRLYDDAGYDLAIDYRSDPEPALRPEAAAWCAGILQRAGRR